MARMRSKTPGKLLSIVLTTVLLLGAVPATAAFAAEEPATESGGGDAVVATGELAAAPYPGEGGLKPAGIVPLATADELIATINSFNPGGSGTLEAFAFGYDTVWVNATTVTGATNILYLNIGADVTVLWNATYSGVRAEYDPLISLSGAGTFMVNGGSITNTGANGSAIKSGGTTNIRVNGGTVESAGNTIWAYGNVEVTGTGFIPAVVKTTGSNENHAAIYATGPNTAVTVSGGTVSGYHMVIRADDYDSVTITVSGTGKVQNTTYTGGSAIYTKGNVTVTGNAEVSSAFANGIVVSGANSKVTVSSGTVSTTGDYGYAIFANNLGINATVEVSGGEVSCTNGVGIYTVSTSSKITVSGTGKVKATGYEGNAIYTYGDVEVKDSAALSTDPGDCIVVEGANSKVTVSGGTVSADGAFGYAIYIKGASATVEVSGGTVSCSTGVGIDADGINSVITVSGTSKVKATSTDGQAIGTSGDVQVTGSAEVSSAADIAILAVGASSRVAVSGSSVVSTADTTGNLKYAIWTEGANAIVAVSGGTVSAIGNDTAIHTDNSGGSVTVSGGTVSATTGYAIRSANVAVSGGFVFAYGAAISNVILSALFTAPTGTGIVTAWSGTAPATYDEGSATALTVLPTGKATWHDNGTPDGIAYANSTNIGFFPLAGVTVTPAAPTVPGAPTIGTATAGNAQASVAFTAPGSNGGSAITGYTVTSSPGGLTATGASSPVTVTGLSNGTAYTFTVKATNAVGTGAPSAASNPVTPSAPPTVPGAPTIGTATAGNAQASVAFTAPASNGGSAVTGYTVTSSPGGLTATGASSPVTVSGLSNGTAYTFTVKATNAVGTGAPSAASNPVTPSAPTVPSTATIRRAGDERIHTALLTSQNTFTAGSSQNVIIALATNFPDALAASTLAGVLDCPILLTGTDEVDTRVSDEIRRLGVTKVYVVGGTAAVSDTVLSAYAGPTGNAAERISGADRIATAIAIAKKVTQLAGVQPSEVFVAYAKNYADALAVSSVAAARGIPILLTDSEALDAKVSAYLEATPSITAVHVLGGTAVVSDTAFQALLTIKGAANTDRWFGADRYDTAFDIITKATARYGLIPRALGIATGDAFPDALAGGAAVAHRGGILLLTPKNTLHPKTQALITTHKPTVTIIEIYGGTSAVAQSVQDTIDGLL